MKLVEYVTPGTTPSIVVIAPFPFMGTERSTGRRYEYIAQQLGIMMLGTHRLGTGSALPNLKTRKRVLPSHFDEWCDETAAELQERVKNFNTVAISADSTAGFDAIGIIKSGELALAAAQFRDAVNVNTPQKPVFGQLNYFRYQVLDERGKPKDPTFAKLTSESATALETVQTVGRFVTEIVHMSPLWRSSYARDGIEYIATAHPGLPISYITLGHSFTGDGASHAQFGDYLRELREQAYPEAAPFVHEHRPDWYHSDLTNHLAATRDIAALLRLAA